MKVNEGLSQQHKLSYHGIYSCWCSADLNACTWCTSTGGVGDTVNVHTVKFSVTVAAIQL